MASKAELEALRGATSRPTVGRTGASLDIEALKNVPKAGRPLDVEPWDIDKLQPHPENRTYFEPLNPDEFAALKDDIEANGIHDALIVTVDEIDGKRTILSGHNRYHAAKDIGLKTVPVRAVVFDEQAQINFIIRDNLLRRQLDTAQKDKLIKSFIRLNPEMSSRAIAKLLSVHHTTVETKRGELAAGGEISHLGKRTGSDGKQHPATKTQTPSKTPRQTAQEAPGRAAKTKSGIDTPGQIIREIGPVFDRYVWTDKMTKPEIAEALGMIIENYLSRLPAAGVEQGAAINEALRRINKYRKY